MISAHACRRGIFPVIFCLGKNYHLLTLTCYEPGRHKDGDFRMVSWNSASAESVAHALGGRRCGRGWLCRCPVSGHGRKRGDINPSLSVEDGDRRLLLYCHAGCTAHEVLDALRARGLLDLRPDCDVDASTPVQVQPLCERQLQAQRLWDEASPAAGTLVESYLRRRGIVLPIPPVIRFGKVTFSPEQNASPAMVVAVQADGRAVIATQSTLLTWSGAKASKVRINCGELSDGAVRLRDPEAILGLAEGVETALAAMQLTDIPCWAALGLRMRNVAVPNRVREIHIFGDDDEPGRKAAERAAEHQTRLSRKVLLRLPPPGFGDWADFVEANQKGRTAA
jgi:hypothetical protein